MTTAQNTINICIGHKPFPVTVRGLVDLFVSPCAVPFEGVNAIVTDESSGSINGCFSEYAQLFWINQNLCNICTDEKFIRIFHYRRFCANEISGSPNRSSNNPWSFVVSENELLNYKSSFSRSSNAELYNTMIEYKTSVADHYATSHIFEDYLNFCLFLHAAKILDDRSIASFLSERRMIPACNIGTLSVNNFKVIYGFLHHASRFSQTKLFRPRSGYQRRNIGFLLERLHSFLLLRMIEAGEIQGHQGFNVVVSDNKEIYQTI